MGLTTINSDNIFQKDVIGNVRQAQEDSHDIAVMTPNGDVFVVCDGMGGHVGGKMASSIAVRSIIEHLKKERYASPYEAMDGALQYANMQILGYANEHPELKGMGTTACILILQDDCAYIAHVGDSRIYLYLGKEKQLHRITKDHSFVQTLVDAGQIKDEEAEHHPNKNRILKALGIKPELQPTFNYQNKPILPKNGDIFLICSDGLSGMISEKTIASVLASKMSLEQKGNMLIDKALKGEDGYPGGQDNITVELIKIDSSKHPKSQFKSYNPVSSKSKRKKGMSAGVWAAIGVVIVALVVAGFFLWNSSMALDYRITKLNDQIKQNKADIAYYEDLLGKDLVKDDLDTQKEYQEKKSRAELELKLNTEELEKLQEKKAKKAQKEAPKSNSVKTNSENQDPNPNVLDTKADSKDSGSEDVNDNLDQNLDNTANKDEINPNKSA